MNANKTHTHTSQLLRQKCFVLEKFSQHLRRKKTSIQFVFWRNCGDVSVHRMTRFDLVKCAQSKMICFEYIDDRTM